MTTTPALTDIKSLIEQHASIQFSGRPTNSRDGKEYHSNCPWCGGTDRFIIWPEVGRYSCSVRSSGCGKHGDAIQFLRDFCDMSYHEACSELDIDPRYPEEARAAALPLFMTKDEPPNQKWMEAAEAFVWRAERYLWTPGGKRGLDYLHSRGLSDETLKRARIGFCPDWYSENLTCWGLLPIQTDEEEEIKIPLGIIIPWFVDNKIWKLSVRRPDKSYFQVLGSSDALYNIDSLRAGQPVLLFESEFDALSIQQEASDLAAMIATGGTSKGRSSRWIARLKQASFVLQCFDQDESGDSGAQEWLSALPNKSMRWRPWAHDGNDMLKSGMPIKLWVQMGLKTSQVELAAPVVEKEIPQQITPHLTTPALEKPSESLPSASVPALPARPSFSCKFCQVRQWIWYQEDHEWLCCQCYSPASWTMTKL